MKVDGHVNVYVSLLCRELLGWWEINVQRSGKESYLAGGSSMCCVLVKRATRLVGDQCAAFWQRELLGWWELNVLRSGKESYSADLKLSINDVSDDVPVVLQRGGCLTGSPRSWYMQMEGTDLEKQSSAISTIKQFYAFVLNAMSIRFNSVTGSGYSITLINAGIYIAT
ncbi:hypothetical protein MAR_002590, partial [Mya arenaria]